MIYDCCAVALEATSWRSAVVAVSADRRRRLGLCQVFSGRAAYIHVGAMIGTIMVRNVFFVIIPGQKRPGRGDPRRARARPGARDARQAAPVHNTYFTLPVLFTMISNHYAMTYGIRHNWLVLGWSIMLAGALIRQYFVLRHSGRNALALPAVAAVLMVSLVIAMAPARGPAGASAAAVSFADVQPIIAERCAVCHSERPSFAGFQQPPGGLMLDTPARSPRCRAAHPAAGGHDPDDAAWQPYANDLRRACADCAMAGERRTGRLTRMGGIGKRGAAVCGNEGGVWRTMQRQVRCRR